MKNLFKVIALSAVALLVTANVQAADAKKKVAAAKAAAAKVAVAAPRALSIAGRVAGRVSSAAKSASERAKSARGVVVNAASTTYNFAKNIAAKGYARAKSAVATGYDYTKSAAQAVGRFARRPIQLVAAGLALGGLYNYNSPVLTKAAAQAKKTAARVSDKAQWYWSCRGEAAKAAYTRVRPSRRTMAGAAIVVAAGLAAYDYMTRPSSAMTAPVR